MTLSALGWNEQFAAHFPSFAADGLQPARVALHHKHAYRLLGAHATEHDGFCTGRLLHGASSPLDLPVVGDWVAMLPRPGERVADIHAVLPRQTAFLRRAAGPRAEAQAVAANLDTIFLMMALDGNYNVRRLERLLALAWDSGAIPVVLLNKLDLCRDVDAARATVARHARGAEVLAISALHETALENVQYHLAPGRTIAVLGSSGVGKSTLVNRLLGEDRQETGARRADNSLGRHTTVQRELLPLPSGALIIDTPGMREVGLWDAGDGLDETFADITALAGSCRFSDCTHTREPGCAVLAGVEAGELEPARVAAWQKLAREQAFHDRKGDAAAASSTKRLWKQRAIAARQRHRILGPDE